MEQELNGPWPLHGYDAVLPPMAGWWMAWANDGSALTHDNAKMLWWDGARWFDARGQNYPHIGHWAGVNEMWPLDYSYPLGVKELLMPENQCRPMISNLMRMRILDLPHQPDLPFVGVPSRTKITYIPKV